MSLLKKNGKSKKDQETKSSQFLEPPPSPSIFRKSTSIEPSGSDVERPLSQQSGKVGGKKKIIPKFFSNLFGNNDSKIPETEVSSNPGGAPTASENKSTSHESINSVLSTSSFSYVNPTKYGGKRVKGKRIPVDDPNYGSTSNGKENEDKKSSGLSTLDKIGMKIGLKKKYNLQSCESLQYIDACEDVAPPNNVVRPSDDVTTPNTTSPNSLPSKLTAEAKSPLPSTSKACVVTVEADVGVSESPASSSSKPVVPASVEEKASSISSFALLQKTEMIVDLPKESPNLKKHNISPGMTPANLPKSETKSIECTSNVKPILTAESSAQTVVQKAEPTIPKFPPAFPKATECIKSNISANVTLESQKVSKSSEQSKICDPSSNTQSTNSVQPILSSVQSSEPQPSTSASALSRIYPCTSSSASATSAFPLFTSTNSNTWSNSGRRKRKAPQPPASETHNDVPHKFTNGVTSNNTSTSIVTDVLYDVPTSSSKAAELKKFQRIQQSPPPPSGKSFGTFEIRPRKKERSVEPLPITRPTSSFASPSTSSKSNTLFTQRSQHKRSCSDGTGNDSNSNTRGRIHKPGKKKAPPPPNPFGDPDTLEDESAVQAPEHGVTKPLAPSQPNTSTAEGSSTSEVTALPPTAPPKLHRKHSCTKPKEKNITTANDDHLVHAGPSTSNPFEIEPVPSSPSPSVPTVQPNIESPASTSITVVAEIHPTVNSGANPTNSCQQDENNFVSEQLISEPDQEASDCTPDLLEEIRQNMLNDQQERQQLGLMPENIEHNASNEQSAAECSINNNTIACNSNNGVVSDELPPNPVPPPTTTKSESRNVINETDLVSAQRTLQALSASITPTSTSSSLTRPSDTDANNKARLLELKREAEKSPMNALKSKSRPISIGSSIYESPLAVLLGKATGSSGNSSSNNSNADTYGESTSPKIASRPWYGALARQLTPSKLKHTTPVKPFTALVKFSELDKEAARIVEENRRKSAERRQLETEQELLELFSSGFEEHAISLRESRDTATSQTQQASSSKNFPTKISTTAQVHSSMQSTSEAVRDGAKRPDSPQPSSAIRENSSSPTFQSVHAASKHRKIKPLQTSSPIANVKSEKLAIVQPQTNNAKKEEKAGPSMITTKPLLATAISSSSQSTLINEANPTVASELTRDMKPANTATKENNQKPMTSIETTSPTVTPNTLARKTELEHAAKPPSTTRASSAFSEWDCPRCTLKNPGWRILCEICFQRKDPPQTSNMASLLHRVNSESNKMVSASSVALSNSGTSTTYATTKPIATTAPTPIATATPTPIATTTPTPIATTTPTPIATTTPTPIATTAPTSISPPTSCPSEPSSISKTVTTVNPTPISTKSSSVNAITIVSTNIPSVVEDYQISAANPSPSTSATSKSNAQFRDNKTTPNRTQPSTGNSSKPNIPHCENFLSQLPTKDDLAKEEKLCGMKLHEDPELEELDIGKLRKARLAYFQKHQTESIGASVEDYNGDDDSTENPFELVHTKKNDLSSEHQQQNIASSLFRGEANEPQGCTPDAMSIEIPTVKTRSTFSDDEDDFLDYIIQLDKENNHENNTTTVANITSDSLPGPSKTTPCIPSSSTQTNTLVSSAPTNVVFPSLFETPTVLETDDNTVCMTNSQIQNRYRPKLAAIREGNTHDYTYCYSSTEIAQIYENWQTSGECKGNNLSSSMGCAVGPNNSQNPIISSGISLLRPNQTHLLEPTVVPAAAPSLVHHHHLNLQALPSNVYPIACNGNNILTAHSIPILPAVLVDHQPYANNRLSGSPEENYVNTAIMDNGGHGHTPTLISDTANFACATSTTPVAHPYNSNIIGGIGLIERRRHLSGESSNNNLNFFTSNNSNMSLTPNGSGRGFSYEDYRRMGAIPKGFMGSKNASEDWSSESSSDSSRGLPFAGRGSGYPDCSPGITRRGTLDAPLSLGFGMPDQTMAVSNLMKQLEVAIANGDHRLAATLAHDMALMKVNCVVAKINQPFSIRVYVEDRFMQQGPFHVQVSSMMSVRDLKVKIERDWGIPSGFQKWILGRQMVEDDNLSLTSYEIAQDSMAFLFIVTPDMSGTGNTGLLPVDNKVNNCSHQSITPISSSSNVTLKNSIEKSPVHGDQTFYNNISTSSSNEHNLNVGSMSPSPSKRPTSANQASGPTSSRSHRNTSKSVPKELSPPPLPAKSPIPSTNSKSNFSTPPSPKSANSSSSPQKKGQNLKKDASNQKPVTSEAVSAASALTQSLQQKLSEFKAVAEQTFGKPNNFGLPPKQDLRHSVKEMSPAPPPPRARSHESSPRRKLGATETKPPVRKSIKSQLSQSSSKEKLTNSNAGSREKLSSPAIIPENRFNGILLHTPKDETNVKPPERLDRVKKPEAIRKKETPAQTEASADKTGKSSVATTETKDKNAEQATEKVTYESLPQPAPTEDENENSVGEARASHSAANLKTDENEASAPQPKPRGIKKQPVSEKVSQGTDSPTAVVPASALPKPFPRTVSSIHKAEDYNERSEPNRSLTQSPLAANDPNQSMQYNTSDEKSQSQVDAVVDDYCQTTLPFPAPRVKPTFFAAINSAHNSGAGSFGVNGSQNEGGGINLLRPSAFVSQVKSNENGTGVLAAVTNSVSSSADVTTNQPAVIPQVEPLTAEVHPPIQPTSSSSLPSPAAKKEASLSQNGESQKEDDSAQSYLKMLELMEKQDLIYTSEDSECPVCLVPVAQGQGIILRDCLHCFCRECLVGCVQYADDSTVKCPYRDNNYACNNNLQEREIKALVPAEVFEKYLARSVKLAESKIVNTFHCKTPDCSGWAVYEDDVNVFLCPVCKKRNCLTCAAIHEGMDCQKYQRELAIAAETDEDAKQSRLMLEKMIQRGEALDCPACHVVLLKKWGCDWVRCSYCKTEICWVTKGFRWGPGGKGDVSGGCKCGVNGVKCHPKCTYCH